MYGVVQNKNFVTIYKFYLISSSLRYIVYKTQEDFEKNINGTQKITPRKNTGILARFGKYYIYEEAYGIRLEGNNYQDISIILDGNKEKEALEERMREAVLAEFNGGIVVPYSDLFKFSVEVVNANNGETVDILQGSMGNTWIRRFDGIYKPTSGILKGKPCMRLNFSTLTEIIPKENKETGENNQSVQLETQRPYIVFISGLQMPHLENGINSLFLDSEDYSKTYYYTYK